MKRISNGNEMEVPLNLYISAILESLYLVTTLVVYNKVKLFSVVMGNDTKCEKNKTATSPCHYQFNSMNES